MRDVEVRALCKRYGEKTVLENFSVSFPAGQVSCLMGPSGCGKTTLLHILMGLETADSGSVAGIPERVSAVFQEDRLCEDFSALRNVKLVTGKKRSDREILECLEAFGLQGSTAAPVGTLSGGMKRRVAIARAVLAEGELLILDEPFKGLDESTRELVCAEVRRRTAGKTLVMVTHDPAEAALMGGRIMEMRNAE